MSPPPAGVNAQLRHLVHYHLDNGFFENALFFAGRLHAQEPRNGDATHLLALCNLRLGRYKAAYDYAKPKGHQPQHLGCAYVFAQAALGLERFHDGAQALEKSRGLWAGRNHWNKHSDTARRHVPDAAACYCLLGKLYSAHGDSKKAIDYYVEALKLNPFMWDAFTGLCDIGAVVRPQNIFKITPEMLTSISHSATNGHAPPSFVSHDSSDARNPFFSAPDADPFNTSARPGGDVNGLNLGGSNLLSKLNGTMAPAYDVPTSSFVDAETPVSNGQYHHDEDVMMGDAGGPVMNQPAPDVHIPPRAPTRKPRMQNLSAQDEPPRMRPITTRSRLKPASETNERTEIPQPQWQNGHKRTVSGHAMHPPPQQPTPADPSAAPPRRSTRLQSVQSGAHNMLSGIRSLSSRNAPVASRDTDVKDRRELRKVKATGTKGKVGSANNVGRVVSGNRKMTAEVSEGTELKSRPTSMVSTAPPPKMNIPQPDPSRDQESLNWLLDLLLRIGSGYRYLSRYECVKALEAFNSISSHQRETPWVLAQIGKAHFERSSWAEADKVFQRLRDRAPSYTEDMDIYSTALWHLKKETDLAYLAHTLVDQDRLSPQTWCALGNAFSLTGDHDQAIKCFTRATQLDPKFAYAFTLQGHEHIENEEYDKASYAYRCAINANNRHYNGWFGLGRVYEMQHKFDVAEKHYRAAFLINPNNHLLAMKIGSVLDRMKKTEAALMHYETAIRLDPGALQARVKKAHILLKLGSAEEALHEFLIVKDADPDSAMLHFYIGKAYQRLKKKSEAIRYFTIAMNLDPVAQRFVKEAMENWDDEAAEWSSEDER